MRFVTFLLGVILGVGGTLAYVVYFAAEPSGRATPPVQAEAPITVALGERFLTGVVQRAAVVEPPQGVEVTSSDLHVEAKRDVLALHAAMTVLGNPTTGTAVMRPVLRDGKLVIDVVETNLGSLPLQPMEKVLEEQINTRIASLLDGMPVTITGVSVDPIRGLVLTCAVDLDQVAGPVPAS